MTLADEFGDYLRGEWLVGRASAMYDEMWKVLSDLSQKRTARRQQEILSSTAATLSGSGLNPESEMLLRLVMAHEQAMAENVLLTVAIHLAQHEAPPPPE
jgi:hypothetical protein